MSPANLFTVTCHTKWSRSGRRQALCRQNWRQNSNFEKNTTCRQILFCRHDNVLFWKRKDTFKNKIYYIYKISLQKGLTVCEKRAVMHVSAAACLALSPPLFTWPVPMIHRVIRSLDFGRNITAFISWPLFCPQSTIVAIRMKFYPTCRQRNLSSTTARATSTRVRQLS